MSTPVAAGQEALKAGDVATALSRFQAATQQNPKDGRAWAGLGMALCQSKRAPEGVEALRRAVSLMPGQASAQYNLAYALEATGAKEDALQSYRRTVALDADHQRAAAAIERLTPREPGGAVAVANAGPQQADVVGGGLAAGQTAPPMEPVTKAMTTPRALRQMSQERSGGGAPVGAIVAILLIVLLVGGGAVVMFVPSVRANLTSAFAGMRPGPVVESEAGGFSARMPGGFPKPKEKTQIQQAAALGTITVSVYEARRGSDEASVGYVTLPDEIFSQASEDKLLEAFGLVMAMQGASVSSSSDYQLGSYAGKELKLTAESDGETKHARMRLIIVQPKLIFIGYAANSSDALETAAATKFLDSLQIK